LSTNPPKQLLPTFPVQEGFWLTSLPQAFVVVAFSLPPDATVNPEEKETDSP